MIQNQFTNQLRTDSFYNVIAVTTVLMVLVTIAVELQIESASNEVGIFWIVLQAAVTIRVGYWSWQLNQQEKRSQGIALFLATHLLLNTVNIVRLGSLETSLIYFYGYFIVVSSTLIRPEASFGIWGLCVLLLGGAMVYMRQFYAGFTTVLFPMGINLLLAVGGFITTLDWQDAVQSTSILHLRAQRRRDELFAIKEELQRAHNRQKSLYTQLITSVEVGQRITTLLDLDVLLNQVVELIKTQFNFVYVGVFLLESRAFLTVRAQAGEKPVSDTPKIRIFITEENLLGLTAANREYMIIADLHKTETPPHQYLSPKAQSEIGLPLVVGNHLHGVLNIQSYALHSFDESNLPMLRLLANQVAIALHNAQLYNAAILARQEAEQANEIKSRFLASMSHELRTPLNAVLNFTGFVADGVFGTVNEEQADALEKSLDSGSHLLSLINDILDLAKIEAGSMDMFIQEVDMNGLLKSTAATAKGLLKHKPVELILNIDENLPHLSADKRRIRQVLLNLVSNAVKFTKEGSITLAACYQDSMIQISVADTGIGIPPEDQDLVFESFHQVENDLFSEMGTGLGLPIAKHFVEAHGGQMWLESEVGIGTTFYVTFPIKATRDKLSVTLTQHEE